MADRYNAVACSAAISALARGLQWQRSLQMLQSLQALGWQGRRCLDDRPPDGTGPCRNQRSGVGPGTFGAVEGRPARVAALQGYSSPPRCGAVPLGGLRRGLPMYQVVSQPQPREGPPCTVCSWQWPVWDPC
eukprot:s188_g9.t1